MQMHIKMYTKRTALIENKFVFSLIKKKNKFTSFNSCSRFLFDVTSPNKQEKNDKLNENEKKNGIQK